MTSDSQPAASSCRTASRTSPSSSGARTAPDASTRSETSSLRSRGMTGTKTAGHAVSLRPGAPAKLDHVAKAARGDHAGARQPPLQHGIGGGRRAVDDEVDVATGKPVSASAATTPNAWFSGVVGVLAIWTRPPSRPSIRIRSVKVPPTSMPATTFPAVCANFLSHATNPKCRTKERATSLEGRFPPSS